MTNSYQGQLLTAIFIVLTNWALLAILTSVVSDNMLSSSAKADEEHAREMAELTKAKRKERLDEVFHMLDEDGDLMIRRADWKRLMLNDGMRKELCDIT
eukprot:CAMPEP_0172908428 /NCGR_PEP_ID=MMETSP1075-20121228/180676_1 /TAXON_ID=2916 /ORGANISM="Ceratium fusus, Strain PA161109" /LENGTH=98 /DNA_ID=CAMNT_0013766193 /DNA_START=87 /DNA_END=380 /DNA_ORIENTATION=-